MRLFELRSLLTGSFFSSSFSPFDEESSSLVAPPSSE
jgi:hypothetical protein